jgi:hypothetical protein
MNHPWSLGLGLTLAVMARPAPAQTDGIDDCARVWDCSGP